MKKRLAYTSFLAIIVLTLIAAGCTSPAGTSPVVGPTASPTVTINPTPVVTGDKITINGQGDGNYNIDLVSGYYLVNVKFSGDIRMAMLGSQKSNLIMSTGQARVDASEHTGSYIIETGTAVQATFAPGNNTVRITSNSTTPYTIEFYKFPLSFSSVNLPRSYKGKGAAVLGPINLKAGDVTFNYTIKGAENTFVSVTLAGTDGKGIGESCACNVDENGRPVENYFGSTQYDLENAGTYYVVIEDTAPGHQWEITVTQ